MIMTDSLKREAACRQAESGSAQSDEFLMAIMVSQWHRNGKERSAELSGTALGSGVLAWFRSCRGPVAGAGLWRTTTCLSRMPTVRRNQLAIQPGYEIGIALTSPG